MSTTTQSTTPATLPAGVTLALDVVGAAAAPAAGDGIPYSKLDIGAAGASSPVTAANPLPVSSATLPLPTGASTAAKQDTGNTSLASLDGKVPALGQALAAGSVPVVLTAAQLSTLTPLASVSVSNFPATQAVSGPLTDTQLRATAVAISDGSGSVTVDAPVGTPVFTRLSDGAAALIGQKVMASSLPVALASDQSAIAVTNTNLDVALSTRLKPADTLAGITTVAAVTSITNAVTITGDVDHDAVNTLKQVQIGGNASPVDVPPTAVSANGDRVRAWMDRYGATIVRRRKIRESYTASFRLAEAAARLDQTFTQVANTNKQWATLYHAATATKEVRLQYCVVYITAWSIASQAVLELRELTGATAPATGNPAITPKPRRVGGTAAEATCLYLPTTAGSETSVNSPIKSWFVDEGIMGAASTANPLPAQGFTLYNSSQEDDEMLPPTLPVGTAGGWAVMLRTVGAPAVRLVCEMGFTEETP